MNNEVFILCDIPPLLVLKSILYYKYTHTAHRFNAYMYIYIFTHTYSKCMNEVSEPDRDVIRTSSHNWNSVIALRRVRQRLFVERLSVIHAPHLFVCTHTDG